MKNLWSYISVFFAGIIVGLILAMKKIKPVINTDSYIENMEQSVGKLKQKGQNNEQHTKGEITVSTSTTNTTVRAQTRRQKNLERRAARKATKEVKS